MCKANPTQLLQLIFGLNSNSLIHWIFYLILWKSDTIGTNSNPFKKNSSILNNLFTVYSCYIHQINPYTQNIQTWNDPSMIFHGLRVVWLRRIFAKLLLISEKWKSLFWLYRSSASWLTLILVIDLYFVYFLF